MSMASWTSLPPSTRTLPASLLTSSASSPLRRVSTAPAAAIASARSGTGRAAHSSCASAAAARSEEHTSELQSLMRISYAVFCLKKKNHDTYTHQRTHEKSTEITCNTMYEQT